MLNLSLLLCSRPKEERFNLGVSALTSALQRAVNKKRFVREERTFDKLERKSTNEPQDKDSRSESQASQAPSHLPGLNPGQSAGAPQSFDCFVATCI